MAGATDAKRSRMNANKQQQQHSKDKTDKQNCYSKAADFHRRNPFYLKQCQRRFLVTCKKSERNCAQELVQVAERVCG